MKNKLSQYVKYLFLLIFISIGGNSKAQSTTSPVPESEYQALVDFYNLMNGSNWYTKWNVSTNNLHEGAWSGITIEDSHIVGIDLSSYFYYVKGKIPASISNLPYLKTLNLTSSDLSTTDLSVLSTLTNLETLDLTSSQLTGAIPSSFGNLTKLKILNLSGNKLSGGIFSTLGNLTGLESLNLSSNEFTSIPTSISSLTKLKTLTLNNNQIKTLPKELESLTSLTSCNVSSNQIENIQALLKSTISLYITSQKFNKPTFTYTGTDVVIDNLPTSLKYNRSKNDFLELNTFYFYVNNSAVATNLTMSFDGKITIPKSSLSNLKATDKVYLYQQSGTLIYSTVNFDSLVINLPKIPESEYQALVDFYNLMNGSNWYTKWNVSTNNLHEGAWSGITIEDSHIVGIDLSSYFYYVKGKIPASISNLPYLKTLNLTSSDLSTTDLSVLSTLTNLETLDLTSSQLTGAIPSSFGNLTKLKILNLSGNKLSGGIFSTLGNLTGLESLNLSSNEFTSIPTSISSLTKLKTLTLNNNQIKTLPKELESLTSLTSCNVSSNQIENIQALLKSTISLYITSQKFNKPTFTYTGTDVVIDNLPTSLKYNRSKNDFLELNTFYFYVNNSAVATNLTMSFDGKITIPKSSLSNLKATDKVYLYQQSGTLIYSTVNFDSLVINLPKIPESEYQALVDFYNLMNGSNWYTKWNVSTNNLHEGAWSGITIEDSHIVGIDLSSYFYYVKGKIPASISNLPYLKTLNLTSSDLSTTDLSVLSTLTNLETLDLTSSQLTGAIPSSFGNLTKLKILNLSGNKLSGGIFSTLGNLTGLESLNLSSNEFTSIPTSISSLTKLKTLTLNNNQIKTLPKELESLTSLTSCNVSSNQIENIQALLKSTISLYITSQKFNKPTFTYTGTDVVIDNLPTSLKYNRSKNDFLELNTFYFYVNNSAVATNLTMSFDGKITIPKSSLSNLKATDKVYLYQQSGTLIYSTVNFDSLVINLPKIPESEYQALVDFYNLMNGSNWYTKWNVSTNNLHEGAWSGITIEDSHIVGIDLSSYFYYVKGKIPASISNLPYLKTLNLTSSDLSTTDLSVLSTLTNLETLNLTSSQLTGAIPSSFGNLTKLKTLELNSNKITGSIPASFGNLINLKILNLNSNNITNTEDSILLLKLNSIDLNYQTITNEVLEIGADELEIELPKHLTLKLTNTNLTFDAQNEFRLYVNNVDVRSAFSTKGVIKFINLNALNLKETDKIYIYQVNGIGAGSRINYNKISFGKPLETTDFEILKKIYNSTGGVNWTNKWDITTNNLHQKSWFGVGIKDGRVISLNLANNNLVGTIPLEISGLAQLKNLNLSNNEISGSIPSTINLLSNLEQLNLDFNSLSGTIPLTVSQLNKLKKFSVRNNQFVGVIPSVLSDFVALNYLDISYNGFDKIEKRLYYDFSKSYINISNQIITYDSMLNLEGKILKVSLSDLVQYDVQKNTYDAKNQFTLLVNNLIHDTATTDVNGNIIFQNVRIAEIPIDAKIAIRQVTGSTLGSIFNFKGIEDKSNIPLVESEYNALKIIFNTLNGINWTNKWNTAINNLHTTKWYGVTIYNGNVVGIDLSNNNLSGTINSSQFSQFPNLTTLNLSGNKLTGIDNPIKNNIKTTLDRQEINLGKINLNTINTLKDVKLNRYNHNLQNFTNQTYSVQIGSLNRTINLEENGIKLIDLLSFWKVPKNQKITLTQLTSNLINSVISYELDFVLGDSNLDESVNILDIQTNLNYIVGDYVRYYNFSASDLNNDDKVNVLDIVSQVKIIQDANLGKRMKSNARFVSDETKATIQIVNNELILNTKNHQVTAVQLSLDAIEKSNIQESLTNLGFSVFINTKNNQSTLIAYTLNEPINGEIKLATLLNSENVKISSALLSNKLAEEVPVEIIYDNLVTDSFVYNQTNNLTIYPNPFDYKTIIDFNVKNSNQAVISVYDNNGKLCDRKELNQLNIGNNTVEYFNTKLSSGIYLLELQVVGESKKTIKIIIK
jgi:Leucine-rich repeat (LRR) protein